MADFHRGAAKTSQTFRMITVGLRYDEIHPSGALGAAPQCTAKAAISDENAIYRRRYRPNAGQNCPPSPQTVCHGGWDRSRARTRRRQGGWFK